ncbi:MAG: glycerol-3-phosphate acyltransferase, partial [Ruminococcus sp.]|nr:glycerol-3-phosphate acyltransferase [Ruminococcus sp.]
MIQFLTIYWWRILASVVIAYILGSINFAVIFTKMASKKDVREMGSGNAGFTNVLRSVGVVPAVFTFLFD